MDHGPKTSLPVEVSVERTPGGLRFSLDGAASKTHSYVAEFETT